MSRYKQFEADLYEKHNDPAVGAVLSHLLSQGMYAVANPDRYGPDIIMYRGFSPVAYIEVEQRSMWHGGSFPWDPINIPLRKGKYFQMGLPCEVWVLATNLKDCLVVPDKYLSSRELTSEEFPNAKIESGEFFYRVPREECIEMELD